MRRKGRHKGYDQLVAPVTVDVADQEKKWVETKLKVQFYVVVRQFSEDVKQVLEYTNKADKRDLCHIHKNHKDPY